MSSNIFLIRSISPLSLRLVQIIRDRCINVDIRLILRLRGLKDSQRKYWPVKVGFRYVFYTLVSKPISVLSMQNIKKRWIFPFFFFKGEFQGWMKAVEFG